MSMETVDFDYFVWCETETPEEETLVITTLLSLIGGGCNEGPMALAKAASDQCEVSVPYALEVLIRHTGPNFGDHFWEVSRVDGDKDLYRLLPPA